MPMPSLSPRRWRPRPAGARPRPGVRPRAGTWEHYGLAVMAVAASAALQLLDPRAFEKTLYLIYVPAVALAGMRGGLGPGLLATLAGGAFGAAAAVRRPFLDHIVNPEDLLPLAIFLLIGTTLVLFIRRMQDHAAALRESDRRFRLLVQSVRDYAIFMLDPGGRVISWNIGAQKIKGYAADDILGRHFSIFYPPEDTGKPAWELEEAARRGSFEDEGWRVRKDGTRFWANVVITAVKDEEGRLTGFAKVTRDLTERRRAEELERERDLRRVIDGVPALVSYVDDRQRYAFNNLAYEQWFGRGRHELRGMTVREAVGDDAYAVVRPHLERALSGQRVDCEIPIAAKDGPARWLHVRYEPDRSMDGTVRGVFVVASDVSAMREHASALEAAVRERTSDLQRSVADLESFTYTITHDLRGPLRAIQGYAHFALRRLEDTVDQESRRLLERIAASSGRMDQLIRDLLAFSGVSRAEFKLVPVDLDGVVAHVIDHYPGLQKADVRVRGPLGRALGQESLLTQCVSNLIENGLKFVAPGHPPCVAVRSERSDGKVVLWFEDNGIGIPDGSRDKIFEPFVRLHPEQGYDGTGIGLAIVKKAVARMGGRVGVESELGRGSRFWIELAEAA